MDYVTLASDSLLETQQLRHKAEYQRLSLESHFILEAMDTGVINVFANLDQPQIVAEGIVIDAMNDFFEKISKFFRERSVKKARRYVQWISENREIFKERAIKQDPVSMREYWKPDWKAQSGDVKAALNKASQNYRAQNYDYKYASKLIDDEGILQGSSNTELSDTLKNYFRFGVNKSQMPDKVSVTGQRLATLIDDMCDYCIGYEKDAVPTVEALSKEMTKIFEGLKKKIDAENKKAEKDAAKEETPAANKESYITPETYLSIEGRTIRESLLTLASNYIILEAGEETKPDDNKDDKKEDGPANDLDTGNEDKTEGDKAKTDAEKAKTDEEKEKEAEAQKQDSDYLTNMERFSKYALSAYTAALEERFVLYVNVFKSIGGKDGKGPRYDKDGKYISSNKEQSDTNVEGENKTEAATDNAETTTDADTGKKKQNVIGRVFNRGNKK